MPLTDYSNLEERIKNAQEPKVLPSGTEVKFRIIAVNSGISDKNDAAWYSVVFDVPSEPLAKSFNDFFWDLADIDKLRTKQGDVNLKAQEGSIRQFKNFAEAIGLDYSRPFSWEDDLPGLEGWAILGVQTDDEYGDKNTIKKYMIKR